MRTFSLLLVVVFLMISNQSLAVEATDCSIDRAHISFVNLENPIAIDGHCCNIKKERPSISLYRRCNEAIVESDPMAKYCSEEPLGSVQIATSDLIPSEGNCVGFHTTLPLHPDLRYFWEEEIRVTITPKANPLATNITFVPADQGLPRYSLTHLGFDTDNRGNAIKANFKVNLVPSRNPPLKVKFAFIEDIVTPANDEPMQDTLPAVLIKKWTDAETLDANCLSNATCGMLEVAGWGNVNIVIPAGKTGILVAGLVYPNAGDGFLEATMATSKKQNINLPLKITPQTTFTPEEEWEIALAEGALKLGIASIGYLFIDDIASVQDNFSRVHITAPQQQNKNR